MLRGGTRTYGGGKRSRIRPLDKGGGATPCCTPSEVAGAADDRCPGLLVGLVGLVGLLDAVDAIDRVDPIDEVSLVCLVSTRVQARGARGIRS